MKKEFKKIQFKKVTVLDFNQMKKVIGGTGDQYDDGGVITDPNSKSSVPASRK